MVLTIILPGKRADLQRNLAGDFHKDFSRELWVLPEAGGEGRCKSPEAVPLDTAAPSNVNFRRNWQGG